VSRLLFCGDGRKYRARSAMGANGLLRRQD
jgi:hypothetical protein